jgi:hypothetical protein
MKIEKFHMRGNNSVYAGAFQLLRGRAPAQLRGNMSCVRQLISIPAGVYYFSQFYSLRGNNLF